MHENEFHLFWEHYPTHRRKGGDEARRLFTKARRTVTIDKLMTSLAAHKKSAQWLEQGGRFVPSMITWLREEDWNLELPEPMAPNRRTPFEQARHEGLKKW